MERQRAGFKFGKYRTTLIKHCGQVEADGRLYKLVLLRTNDGLDYYAMRLYNRTGKFIKQFLFEPYILNGIIDLLVQEASTEEAKHLNN